MAPLRSILPLLGLASSVTAGLFKTSLEVTWVNGAPDGFERPMFKVNGTSPGPLLRINQGDDVEITVCNKSPKNITIHWHGITQQGTLESDGVPGVTMRAIQPDATFVYRFNAQDAGSYWYHAHNKDQLMDGMSGPIFIVPRNPEDNPFHMIDDDCDAIDQMTEASLNPFHFFGSDWDHMVSEDRRAMMTAANVEDTCFSSVLVNGKGRIVCRSPEELAAAVSPGIAQSLSFVPNSTLTEKGCVPAENLVFLGGGVGDPSKILPSAYHDCKTTKGPVDVFEAGVDRWVAIQIVSAFNFISPLISIDNHDMYIYAVDGNLIEPQKVQAIPSFNAERYSVMVKTHTAGDFQIRVVNNSPIQILTGYAVLRVRDGVTGMSVTTTTKEPDSTPYFTISGMPIDENTATLFDPYKAFPYPAQPVPIKADSIHRMGMTIVGSSIVWSLNGTPADVSALEDRETPFLFEPPTPDHFQTNNSIATLNGTWVDLLFETMMPVPHSLHKHSNPFRPIGGGTGPFKWASVEEAAKEIPDAFNFHNPPKRDTLFTAPALEPNSTAWQVFRYQVVNPGPVLLHCHIQTHMGGGMVMVIFDGVDKWPKRKPQN